MNFKELISKLRIHKAYGNLNVPVKGIAYDSRRVLKDFVFVAIRGFSTDGHKHIKQALDNGACALVVEKPIQNLNVPWVQVDNTRMALAEISAAFYGYPCNEMEIIGITGTNGKTTTAFLMNAVLKNLGYKTGLIGTIYNIIGEETFESINTTPESLDLQHMLSEMSSKGIRHVTMEVSSHALSLYRTHGISFKAAIFTNLSQDHLDFHSDMNEYASAKAKLFEAASLCVINRDDAWASQMIDASKGDVITYGIYNDADIMAKNIKIDSQGINFDVTGKYGNKNIKMKL
ncbi:UDP-N-acetylmuramoyl-L-alanyl-D-glutamate--2,6-diaminopimelate ligase, partial [Peptococcaceae bacterium]|nr:UDP-N-acetylmuramoyl-L-alanyl-D-glutamate--2,6-diaminopimelate ligase [Peptococcaceae bacterium]